MAGNFDSDFPMTLGVELKSEMSKPCELSGMLGMHEPLDSAQPYISGLGNFSVGSVPGEWRSPAEALTAATAGISPESAAATPHHQHFSSAAGVNLPPSPGVPVVDSTGTPVMQQVNARTHFLDENSIDWLTQSLRDTSCIGKPLDLRPQLEPSIESWVSQREYSELLQRNQTNTDQNAHRMAPCSYDNSDKMTSSDDSFGDMPSPSFLQQPDGGPPIKLDTLLSEKQLTELSVRELNRRLHGCPSEVIKKLKQKRRTLKNRGYAQNCRTKRIALKSKLEKENSALKIQVSELMQRNTLLVQERDSAIHELNHIRDYYELRYVNNGNHNANQVSSSSSSTSSPDFYM